MSLKDEMAAAGVKPVGFVKQKIRHSNPKNRGVGSRARASGRRLIKRAQKKLATVLKQFPSTAVNKAITVLAGQLTATKRMWDPNAKCLIDIPDEKIRQDAALAILAYDWGQPVAKQVKLEGTFEELGDVIERFNNSPAAQDFVRRLASGELQKTGGEKPVENARVIDAETSV